MSNQLTDYQGIRACLDWRDPNNIRVIGRYQMTLDGPGPQDQYVYDHLHRLHSVTLWGKNADVLRKTAQQILCDASRNEPVNRTKRHEPSTVLVFSQA